MSTDPAQIHADAGQVLMIGFESDPEPACSALSEGRAGGVILFSRNIGTADQVRALNHRLTEAAGGVLPIAVDQEGGRVARLAAAGLEAGPPARDLAEHGEHAVHQWGLDTGKALAELGFTIDFAPILDVDTNPDNPIIGDRSYGRDADRVIRMARAAAEGLMEAGILPCGKHFPGHGDTELDSHLDLPYVNHDEHRLREVELAPFAALAPELPAIMTAHVVFTELDPEVPATLSKKIVTGLLKDEFGFGGVVVSDDLEMAAVARLAPPGELAVRAIEAGCDLLLCCKLQSVWEEAHEALMERAIEDGEFAARLADAAARVRKVLVISGEPV